MIDLELVSTEELIAELFNRKTFAGVLIYSPADHKFQGQNHPDLALRTTCEDHSVMHLLEQALETMRNRVTEDET